MRARAALACVALAACATPPPRPSAQGCTRDLRLHGEVGDSGAAPAVAATRTEGLASADAALVPRDEWRFSVEVWFMGDDGSPIAAAPVTVGPRERGGAHVLRPVGYVRDADVSGPAGGEVVQAVRATAVQGVHVDYAVATGGALDEGTVAVAFCVASARVDEPVARRSVRIAPPPVRPISIALPRGETIEYAGARRVRLGKVVDLATFPSYDGEKTVRLRISRTTDGARSEGVTLFPSPLLDRVASPFPGGTSLGSRLSSLLRAALRGDPERRIAVDEPIGRPAQYLCGTVSGPRGSTGGVAFPAFGLPCLAFTSIVAPGFAMARRVETSYVRGFTIRGGLADPEVAVHTSGIGVSASTLNWMPAPEFIPRARDVAPGFVAVSDHLLSSEPRGGTFVLPDDGAVVVPLGRFVGSGPTVVRVVSTPWGAPVTPAR